MRVTRRGIVYPVTLGVIGLLILLVRIVTMSASTASTEGFTMGQAAIDAMHALEDRDAVMLYFDVAATHAATDAIVELLNDGGWEQKPCGSYGTVSLWYDRGLKCLPTAMNLSEELSIAMRRTHFTHQLVKVPFIPGKKEQDDFVYYAGVAHERVVIAAASVHPFTLNVLCRSQHSVPVGVGGDPLDYIPSEGIWKDRYACGVIALRPDTHTEFNVSVSSLIDIGVQMDAGVTQCDGDRAPESCLVSFANGVARWQPQVIDEGSSIVALYTFPLNGTLPGIDQALVGRVGIRLRKGQEQSTP